MKSKTIERFLDGELYISLDGMAYELIELFNEQNITICSSATFSYEYIGYSTGNKHAYGNSRLEGRVKMSGKDFLRKVSEEMSDFENLDLKPNDILLLDSNDVIIVFKGTSGYYLNKKLWAPNVKNILNNQVIIVYRACDAYNFKYSIENNQLNTSFLSAIWEIEKEQTEAEKQLEKAKELLREAHTAIDKAQEAINLEKEN